MEVAGLRRDGALVEVRRVAPIAPRGGTPHRTASGPGF